MWWKSDQRGVIYTTHVWRSDLQPQLSKLLAALRNSGRSLQKICQILSSSSIPGLLCLAGLLLTPYDARLLTAPCKHLQSCIIDALSCAGPVIHSEANLHNITMSSSNTVDGNWLNLWKTSVISSDASHLLSFVAEGTETSNPVIDVNGIALLWLNLDAQFVDRDPSPMLFSPHAIHSWCRPVSRKADIILTDCYANNASVTGFCHQNSLRAFSFCRMIDKYEDRRVRLLVSTGGKFI